MAKKLTPKKAKQILHDKSVHGNPLTDKQRKFFGAVASGYIKAENGAESRMGGLTDIPFRYNGAWGGPSMETGGWLDKYTPKAQTGKKVIVDGKEYDTSSPEYSDLYRFGDNPEGKGSIGYFDKNGVLVTSKMTLPEVVVWPKNKSTQEFYDNIGDSERYALEQLTKKYGPVNIDTKEGSGVFSKSVGHYNPFTNTITINPNSKRNPFDTYIAELAHKKQFDDRGKLDAIGNWIFKDLPAYTKKAYHDILGNYYTAGKSSPYETPGTIEYEAHRIYEPKLSEEAIDYRQEEIEGRNYNKFETGGWLDKYAEGGNIQPPMAGADQTVPMYQMGGNVLPGAAGFMYARTHNPAPSEGPYAKKTMPSAQNGQEMRYYQHGLDWKPKNISQDGDELKRYGIPSARELAMQNQSSSTDAALAAKMQADAEAARLKSKMLSAEKESYIAPARQSTPQDERKTYELNKQYALENNLKFNYKTGDVANPNDKTAKGGDWGKVQTPAIVKTLGDIAPGGEDVGKIQAPWLAANALSVASAPGLPAIGPALNAPFTVGSTSIPWLTGNTILSALGAYNLAEGVSSGMIANRFKNAKDWSDYTKAGAETAFDIMGALPAGMSIMKNAPSVMQDVKQVGKYVSEIPSTKVLFQSAEQRLNNPTAYNILRGKTLGVRGTVANKIKDYKIRSLYGEKDRLEGLRYDLNQKGQYNEANRISQRIENLKSQINKTYNNYDAWRLKYSGLPLGQTTMSGGQGKIYSNLLNQDELVKVGSYMGDEQSMQELIDIGKKYSFDNSKVAFPTKYIPLGEKNIVGDQDMVQFMPKLNFKPGFTSGEYNPKDVLKTINKLDELGVGIDYQGYGNIGTVGNKPGFVDLTYVGKPGSRIVSPGKQDYMFKLNLPAEKRVEFKYPNFKKDYEQFLSNKFEGQTKDIIRGPIPNPYPGTTISGRISPNVVGQDVSEELRPFIMDELNKEQYKKFMQSERYNKWLRGNNPKQSGFFLDKKMFTNPREYFTKSVPGKPEYIQGNPFEGYEKFDPEITQFIWGNNYMPTANRVIDWNKVGKTAAGIGIGSGLISAALNKKEHGGLIKAQEGREIKNAKNWLKDWYSARSKNPKFQDIANERLNILSKININKDPNLLKLAEAYGTYSNYPDNYDVNIDTSDNPIGKKSQNVIHEISHAFDNLAPQKNREQILKENALINPYNRPDGSTNFGDQSELLSRLYQFREMFNIDPSKEYSVDDMKQIINDFNKKNPEKNIEHAPDFKFNIREFFNMIDDDPEKLRNLNRDIVKNNAYNLPVIKKGGIIEDDRGQWAHPGKNTRISSPNITMQGVNYPVLAKANTGEERMMYPNQDYYFPGAEYVDEYPVMQKGGELAPYEGYSVVDFLAAQNQPYDYKSRKELATSLGIKNYRGKGEQNLNLINLIKENPNVLGKSKPAAAPEQELKIGFTPEEFIPAPMDEEVSYGQLAPKPAVPFDYVRGEAPQQPPLTYIDEIGRTPAPIKPKPATPVTKSTSFNELLAKQAYKESTFRPDVVNKKGYKGLAQLGDAAIQDYKRITGDKNVDPLNPAHAVKVQKFLMDNLYNSKFINVPGQSENVRMAKTLAAYNWGRGNVSKFLNRMQEKGVDIYKSMDWINQLPKETRDYINKVLLSKDDKFNKEYERAISSPKNKTIRQLYNINTFETGGWLSKYE